ncbi:MAG TPA: hypothetical protein VIH43_03310 [Chthoniobacterales bacterium]|jgi:hypothetical protein
MKQLESIVIPLTSVDQLVDACPPSPFRRRRLKEEAEQYLIERVNALPGSAAVSLLITLPQTEASKENTVVVAIHEHFNCRRIEAEKQLARIRRFGWRSLGIALLFLAAAMLIVQLMKRYLPPVTPLFVITEGLTIFAWVALWRPGELLLYEWYPFKRDARLFQKLERCEVRFSYNTR